MNFDKETIRKAMKMAKEDQIRLKKKYNKLNNRMRPEDFASCLAFAFILIFMGIVLAVAMAIIMFW